MLRYIATDMGLLVVNYLDDFAGVSPPEIAERDFEGLGRLLEAAGAEENLLKAICPTTAMPFVGILANTIDMTLNIPPDKLYEIYETLREWEGKITTTRTELESLIGKLAFIARCVQPGRIFISRLLEGLRSMPRKGKHPVTPGMRKDIIWWQRFAPNFQGVSQIPNNNLGEPDTFISCDATPTACGGWAEPNEYFREVFPSSIRKENWHISALEMVTLTVTVKLWVPKCHSQRLQVFSDNQATVIAVNTGKTRDSVMASCLRELTYILAKHNCELKVRYINTKANTLSDLLSRWKENRKKSRRIQTVNTAKKPSTN